MGNGLKIQLEGADSRIERLPTRVNNLLSKWVMTQNYTIALISFLIYTITFYTYHFLSQKTFFFDFNNLLLLGYYLLSLSIGAIISKKFNFEKRDQSEQSLRNLFHSLFISLSILTILLITFVPNLYREYVLIAMFSGLVFESYYFMILSKKRITEVSFIEHKKLSIKYLLFDGMILFFFCYIEIIRNIHPTAFRESDLILLSVIFMSWIISAATTHKFIPVIVSKNRWNAIELQTKFYLRIVFLVVLSLIFLQVDFEGWAIFVRAIIGYSLVSSFVSVFLFAGKIKNKTDEATVVFLKAYEMKDPENPPNGKNGKNGNTKYRFDNVQETESLARNKLQFEYLKEYGEVFSVLDNMLDLKSFDTRKSVIIKTHELVNSFLIPNSNQLFVNLHILNDQVNLNNYLLEVRNSLLEGGVFVGAFLPHHYRYRRYLKKYAFWTANFFYFFDFIWKRVFPKIPIARELYSAFSQEKDRALSLAEGLGRLVYCGFKILDLTVVDDVVYFAAVKDKPSTDAKKFFYSPIFKMKRVGEGGKIIYVYKLRTMYPYSEFIQSFVYKHNNLDLGGKFKDDFRVPSWGKIFRKLWIDELPMLINWVQGDLKIVGVRPISAQYLSLYSEEHQERRKEFKPGLFPPFYADLPKTIGEIEQSEKRYLDLYEKNPVKTDIKYFFKILNNILIKKKRSA